MADEPAFEPQPGLNPLELLELFSLSEEEFRRRFRHTPLWRPRRRGLLRNAAVVLGNQRHARAVPVLAHALQHESDPVVRGACAWALGRIATAEALAALKTRLAEEPEAEVRDEILAALAEAEACPRAPSPTAAQAPGTAKR